MTSEKEKMLAGELYDPLVPELVAERERAREIFRLFDILLRLQAEES